MMEAKTFFEHRSTTVGNCSKCGRLGVRAELFIPQHQVTVFLCEMCLAMATIRALGAAQTHQSLEK